MNYSHEQNDYAKDDLSEELDEDLPDQGEEASGNVSESEGGNRSKARQNAATKKKIKKQEKNIKKSEDKIVDFLIKFIKSKHNNVLLITVTRVLSFNISAIVILHSLILSNPELMDHFEDDDTDDDILRLKSVVEKLSLHGGDISVQNKSIEVFTKSSVIPPHLLVKLNIWMEGIIEATLVYPEMSYEIFKKEEVQDVYKHFLSLLIMQYLDKNGINVEKQSNLMPLVDNIFNQIIDKLAESINSLNYLT